MTKSFKENLAERRKYIRLEVPLAMSYSIPGSGKSHSIVTKDVSPDGLRFETADRSLKESGPIEASLEIAASARPVLLKGRIIWSKKVSLEDNAPFDVGVEFTEIEDEGKNAFLKFLCDLLYNLPEGSKHAKKRT